MLSEIDDREADAGVRHIAHDTERLCVATRAVRPVSQMLRFVAGPDGSVVPDLKRKLPGRGVWVTATQAAVQEAVKRNAFARSLKTQVKVAPDLDALVEALLVRSVLDALAIVHKAGRVAIGFSKAEAALTAGPVVALLHAADASADGVRKITAAARRRFGAETGLIPVVASFTSAQLDLALGRSNVIHAALLAGPASNRFLARHLVLGRFRTVDPDRRGEMMRDQS